VRTAVVVTCALVFGAVLAAVGAGATNPSQVFTANAIEGEDLSGRSVAVTFVIDRYTTEGENAAVVAALHRGTTVLHALLEQSPDIGSILVGDRTFPIKYVYSRARARTRVTLLVNAPIAFLGDQQRPKDGFDFAMVVLDFSLPGFGSGEVDPAVKLAV